MSDPIARSTRGRAESREVAELRALKERQPDLGEAVDMHIALVDLQRRVQSRIPLPGADFTRDAILEHERSGQPLLRFEDIPLDLSDLRLLVRQIADVLRQFRAIEDADYAHVQSTGRDMQLVALAGTWYRRTADRSAGVVPAGGAALASDEAESSTMLDQVLALAMKPFLARCAELLQPREELSLWTHGHCPMCGGEPELAAITPAAERHLICGRCTLRWRFEPLTCPYCRNSDRSRITSFATPDGQYRVYACDVCRRYLKAYDGRRAARQVMPVVDAIATLPLDAAAMQRGYSS